MEVEARAAPENLQGEPLGRVDYISGPISYYHLISKKYKKNIYLFGDAHQSRYNSCEFILPEDLQNNVVDIVDFLEKTFMSTQKMIDFYLETPHDISLQIDTIDYMSEIENKFTRKNCLPVRQSECDTDFNMVRFHYIDIRSVINNPLDNMKHIFYEIYNKLQSFYDKLLLFYNTLLKQQESQTENNCVNPLSIFEEIELFLTSKLDLIINQIDQIYIFQREKIEKQLKKITAGEIIDYLNNLNISNNHYFDLVKKICKAEHKMLFEMYETYFKSLPFLSRNCDLTYFEIIEKELKKILSRREKIYNILDKANIYINTQDLYNLSRIFKTFGEKKHKTQKNIYDEANNEANNIIIYAGDAHILNIRRHLQILNFEDIDYKDFRFDERGKHIRCIDVHNLEIPLFSKNYEECLQKKVLLKQKEIEKMQAEIEEITKTLRQTAEQAAGQRKSKKLKSKKLRSKKLRKTKKLNKSKKLRKTKKLNKSKKQKCKN